MKKLVQCKSVEVTTSEKLARQIDQIIKTLPKECQSIQRKSLPVTDTLFEPNEKAEISIITAATVDKSNQVVLPDGLDRSHYSNVVLYNHNKDIIVGQSMWIKYCPKDETLRAKTRYYENVEQVKSNWYRFIDEIWTMVKAGAMKGKSVGFLPLLPLREPSEEELKTHPEWSGAMIWEKGMLLEYSVCPVGVNSESIVELINTKSINPYSLEQLGIKVPVQKCDCVTEKMKSLSEKYNDKQRLAIADAVCNYKPVKKKMSTAEAVNRIIKQMELDSSKLAQKALDAYKNRGRV